MTTLTRIVASIGACVAATLIALQWRQISTERQSVLQLETQVAQVSLLAQTNQALQATVAQLQEQNAVQLKSLEALQQNVAKTRARAAAALAAKPAATTPAAASIGTTGNLLADMFKDPATLEAMRPQQIATEKMMYGPLVKQLNLSPEQADQFYNILVDSGFKALSAMQSGKSSPGDMEANTQATATDLRSLLGDAGFAQYQDYTKNDMADQSMLSLLKNDFGDNPLNETQQQQLLQAMKTARQSVTASNPLDMSPANSSDKLGMMGQVVQQQEQMNQNVLQQAAAFLSPVQLQTLSTSQSNMIALQKSMGPVMQKMFPNSP